jgi:hypothetical protein
MEAAVKPASSCLRRPLERVAQPCSVQKRAVGYTRISQARDLAFQLFHTLGTCEIAARRCYRNRQDSFRGVVLP